ncbi:hypothetical protein SLE2022_001590 [Rubroshorea leprosula]
MSEMTTLESYPPLFRNLNGHSHISDHHNQTVGDSLDSDPLPLIDLQLPDSDKLGAACKNWGIFRLVNHGIPPTLTTQLQDSAKMLFSLPFESKQALFNGPVTYFWGTPALTTSGTALRGALNINWLEGLSVFHSQVSQVGFQDPMINAFRLLLEEYGRHQVRIAKILYGAMSKNLNLDSKQSQIFSEPIGYHRIYRYPVSPNPNELSGMEEHTDSSVLTILHQDQVGGLEFFRDNKWLPVKHVPNTLIVNIGDMMQAASDDEYISVKHRVRVNKDEERFSICYFEFPADGAVIHSSKYKPFTYPEFSAQVQEDIKTVGYKVGLPRFKLHPNS